MKRNLIRKSNTNSQDPFDIYLKLPANELIWEIRETSQRKFEIMLCIENI